MATPKATPRVQDFTLNFENSAWVYPVCRLCNLRHMNNLIEPSSPQTTENMQRSSSLYQLYWKFKLRLVNIIIYLLSFVAVIFTQMPFRRVVKVSISSQPFPANCWLVSSFAFFLFAASNDTEL